MIFQLLLILLSLPQTSSRVSVINLSLKDKGAVERVKTAVAVLPSITVCTEGEFSQKHKNALKTTMSTLGKFPSKLAVSLLRKQLKLRKLNELIILTSKGIYVVKKRGIKGPFAIPGVHDSLGIKLLGYLNNSNTKPLKKSKKSSLVPWWKNWIFWTGVAVITGSLITFSILNKDPDTVDIHVQYP